MQDVLARLERRLIVSSQAMDARSPLKTPAMLSLLAQAAELGGAGGFRVDGPEVVADLRAHTRLPIIGISKSRLQGFDTYITVAIADVGALCAAGADIVAAQSTVGTRPADSFAAIAAAAARLGRPVMADIATLAEAEAAVAQGAALVATTMYGFTAETAGRGRPDFALLAQLVERLDVPVVLEGGVWTPEHVRAAFEAGAYAVVSGSAVTAPDLITRRLVEAIPAPAGPPGE